MWLVAAGITALLELGQNTTDHRFQQPQFWVSNRVVALKRGFCLFSECLLYQADQVDTTKYLYLCFQEKQIWDLMGSIMVTLDYFIRWGHVLGCSWEDAFDCMSKTGCLS